MQWGDLQDMGMLKKTEQGYEETCLDLDFYFRKQKRAIRGYWDY